MPTTALRVALALEVLLADFALIRLILLNLGGLTAPCLARRGLERGLGGLFRRLDEWKLVVAGNSAPRTSSTCAATGNCANKVAVLLGLPGQDVLAVNSTQLHEESVQSVEGKLRRGAHAVEFRDGGVLALGGPCLLLQPFSMACIRKTTVTL